MSDDWGDKKVQGPGNPCLRGRRNEGGRRMEEEEGGGMGVERGRN